jgi:hypothetical protein
VTGFEPATSSSRTKRATKLRYTPYGLAIGNGRDRIRTCEGVRQQIYSLPPLSTWVLARKGGSLSASERPGKKWKVTQEGRKAAGRTRTADLKITNHALCQLSYGGLIEQGMRQGSGRQSGAPCAVPGYQKPRAVDHGVSVLVDQERNESNRPWAGALEHVIQRPVETSPSWKGVPERGCTHCLVGVRSWGEQRRGCSLVLEETEEERGNSPYPDTCLSRQFLCPACIQKEDPALPDGEERRGKGDSTELPFRFFDAWLC